MRYEVRTTEFRRSGKDFPRRVRVERVIGIVQSLEMAVDMAARWTDDVRPDDGGHAWVLELPSNDGGGVDRE